MKKQLAVALLIGGCLLTVSGSAAQVKDQVKDDEALAKALKEADTLFTAKVGKVSVLAQTNSIPPATLGKVVFKEAKALRGTVAEDATYSYTYRKGTTKNLDLQETGMVLVAVKQKAATAIVPATDANLALAKKFLEGGK
jgi:hypothetical protein